MAVPAEDMYRRTQDAMEARQAVAEDAPPRKAGKAPRQLQPRRRTWLEQYEDASLRGAIGATFLLWFGIWAVDGYFTVLFLAALFPAIPWYVGVVIHVGVSLIQNHLWKDGARQHLLTLGLILLFNVGTSMIGALAQLADWTTPRAFAVLDIASISIPRSSALTLIGCALALLIAVAPEWQARKYAQRLV